jgi:hypothetical protein
MPGQRQPDRMMHNVLLVLSEHYLDAGARDLNGFIVSAFRLYGALQSSRAF